MGRVIAGHGYAVEFLQEQGISAHYLIETDGTVIECVDPELQAYHAGKSRFKNKNHLNKTFIGIEVLVDGIHQLPEFWEVIKDPDSFTPEQRDSTAVMCALLMDRFKIPFENIVSHHEVSGPHVRPDDPKFDVGSGFDWSHFKTLVKEFNNQLQSSK